MTACSAKEEMEWRSRLDRPEATEPNELRGHAMYSSNFLNIRSLGAIFGKPGTYFSPWRMLAKPTQLTLERRDCCSSSIDTTSDDSRTEIVTLPGYPEEHEFGERQHVSWKKQPDQSFAISVNNDNFTNSGPGTLKGRAKPVGGPTR
jgi:hypothetical protein